MKIIGVVARDICFPTSKTQAGSDAVSTPDYSVTYVVLKTDSSSGLRGHGLTFSPARGNELVVAGIETLSSIIIGQSLESISADFLRSGTRGL